MSMCMYLRQVSDAEAMRFRRDPGAVLAATVGAQFGQPAFPADMEGPFGDGFADAFAQPRGLFGWIKAWFIKRALKALVQKQLEQLTKAHAAMAAPPSGAASIPSPGAIVDLHKSWQILHFVLTGTPESGPAPLNILLAGGEEVGEDLGYGPARIIDARAMHDFAKALANFELDDVVKRLDIERMAAVGVYCVDKDDDREAQALDLEEDMRHHFPALKAFAGKAAGERQGALIWMS
jgi:hypothetical protein